MASDSGKLFPFHNSGLFSEYYLSNILKEQQEWKADVKESFHKIISLYKLQKKELLLLNEDSLEDNFIQPILKELSHTLEPQPSLPPALEGTKRPDLAIFPDAASRKTALPHQGKEKFFTLVSAICEVKRWGRPLDKKLKTEADPFEAQNPSLQISRYLWLSGVKWGILTDGRLWRLYERESSKRLDVYYEIDLPDLLEKGDTESFKYFVLLFRREAIPVFLDKIYQGSVNYAKEVGEDLKKNIYEALKVLAEGFLKNPANRLGASQLEFVRSQALIYLYRLLFILYAEDRNLLPTDNPYYRDAHSLHSLRDEISKKLDKEAEKLKLSPIKFTYWEHLQTLFKLINEGSQAHGIPLNQMYVPPYNGGLFEPERHESLEKWKVGDSYLSRVIDLLSRSPVKKDGSKAFVSYRDLAIRDLGSIYEGLLEYRLKLTPGNALDLVTDKGERKATGSYYTPDYIVTYIVESTLGPLIQEKKEIVSRQIQELREKFKKSRGYNREAFEKQLKEAEGYLIDEIFSLKVLDPAMGSAHFLVEATDYLARALVEALSGLPVSDGGRAEAVKDIYAQYGEKDFDEEDIRWARREVIEKCIYGVDLNPLAVELAKLSLWLSTVAKDKPLSFLDHHLRCGNSLIGAKVTDLAKLPKLSGAKTKAERYEEAGQLTTFELIFKENVSLLLKDFELIESVPSETVEQIKEKEKLYQDFRQRVRRFQDVADIWTSRYFGNEVSWSDYQSLQEKLRAQDEEWQALSKRPWFKVGPDAAQKYHFFHWELEFPEVFFKGSREKENPGFDAVIGNPPYGGELADTEKKVLKLRSSYMAAGKPETYLFFLEKAIDLCSKGGALSFIIPNAWLTNFYARPLREQILTHHYLYRIVDLTKHPVFPDAIVDTSIPVIKCRVNGNSVSFIDKLSTAGFTLSQRYPQQKWLLDSDKVIRVTAELKKDKIIEKLVTISDPLSKVCETCQGIIPYKTKEEGILNKHILSESKPDWKPLLDAGECVDRYSLEWRGLYLNYGDWLWCPREPKFFESAKILFHRLRKQLPQQLIGVLDAKRFYNRHSLSNIILRDRGQVDLKYVLSLFNSTLLNYWFVTKYGLLMEVGIFKVNQLPIRSINFVTPQKERSQLLEKGKTLYERCLAKNDYLCVTGFVDHCLKQKPEQADVVHDLLAFLAERMIEMNKENQAEAKGFLEWLEVTIGTKANSLKNKTKITAYHEGSLEDLLEILKENRKALNVNPASKDFFDALKDAFQKSMAKLSPLKNNIATTDRLIDLIVYRLYGLTEEEVKIVEGKAE